MSDTHVSWFEIPTQNLDRAQAFYEQVLDQTLGELPGPEGSPMRVFLGENGANGALLGAEDGCEPGNKGPRIYLNCADINAAMDRVASAGGTVIASKTAIGPHGFIATLADPDGNWVSLHHPS